MNEKKYSDRKEYISVIYDLAVRINQETDDSTKLQRTKAERVLISWAFIFSGFVGMYQAGILDKTNKVELFLLIVTMLVSLSIAVSYGIGVMTSEQIKLTAMKDDYTERVDNDEDLSVVTIKETIINNLISRIEKQNEKLEKATYWINISGYLIILELLLIILFIIT